MVLVLKCCYLTVWCDSLCALLLMNLKCLSVYLLVCLSICLSGCMYVCLSICLSAHLCFAGLPYGEPQCLVYATRNEYLMLSCSWQGGSPRALLWWVSSSGNIQSPSEDNSNILVLRSSATYSSKAFVCHAKHPLSKETKQCVLTLGETFKQDVISWVL